MAWGRRKKQDEPLVYNSLDELLALLAAERQKTLKSRRGAKVGLGIYLGILVLFLIIGALTHFRNMGGFGGMFGGLGGMIASMYAATNTQKKGVQALAEFSDIRAVPRLIEMLEYNDTALRVDAANLLQKLLPLLRASDASMLLPEHHAILNRLLAGKLKLESSRKKQTQITTEPLQITTLRALQQIGDASSLPFVMEIANDSNRNTRLFSVDVAEAARECLPFLQNRAENQRQTQTLLRASDGNHTPTDVLLRPAMSAIPNTPSEELLRAAPQAETLPAPHVLYSAPISQPPQKEAEQETQIAHLSP